MKVVSNSSPLIGLAAINQFDLLKPLYQKIYIPKAVYKEVVVSGKGEPGSNETRRVLKENWIKIKEVKDELAVKTLTKSLDDGEAEAIILAKEIAADTILLDDPQARTMAAFIGLEIIGVVGILLLATTQGFPVNLKENLEQLIKEGFRIDSKLYKQILKDFKPE